MHNDWLSWLAHPATAILCGIIFCLIAYVVLAIPEVEADELVPADGWQAFAKGYGLLDNPYLGEVSREIWAAQWQQARHADGLASE